MNKHKQEYLKNGYLYLKNFFDKKELFAIKKEAERYFLNQFKNKLSNKIKKFDEKYMFDLFDKDFETFTTDSSSDNTAGQKIADNCPDVLIQKGSALFLYNSKRANVPGINPIRFETLEEYVEFTEWQRSQGILCPVLYLQHAYDAQGEPVYKARPSPTHLYGGQPDYIVTPASLPTQQIMYPNIPPNIMPPPAKFPVQGLYAQNTLNALPLPPNNTQMDFVGAYTGSAYTGGSNPYAGATNSYPGFDPQNQMVGCNSPLDKMFNQTNGVSPNPMDANWGGVEYTENLVKAGYFKGNEISKGDKISFAGV